MDYQRIIEEVYKATLQLEDTGEVADYIPELAKVDADKFGVHLTTLDSQYFSKGDSQEKFSIQSVAKVFSLVLAYEVYGEKIWERVDVEPSGAPFNSLALLENDEGIPRNPFINAGALVVSDILVGKLKDPKADFLNFIRRVAATDNIHYNSMVALSEKSTGFRNAAMINLMKSFGNIHNDIYIVLDFYFHLCSLEMTCQELACSFLFLANDGINPYSEKRIISTSKSKRINAVMQLCGFYDEAGEFSFRVGLPGKSGVGGGIAAILPDHYAIATWSPRLNPKGNSFKGMNFLEKFTTATEHSIF